MDRETILADPTVAHYCDPKRGWIHEVFADGVEYGEQKTIDRAIGVLIDMANEGLVDLYSNEKMERIFRTKMEEKYEL